MDYFKNRKNVDLYTDMVVGSDNSFVISELKKVLPAGSEILEIGMGTGADTIALSEDYSVIGSDSSEFFIEDFKKKSDIEVMLLDAVDFDINRTFDCIYSNKVLQHLAKSDFVKSLKRQCRHLTHDGMIFATLWAGEHREEYELDGQIRFVYYDEFTLRQLLPDELRIAQIIYYSEFEPDDSLILILSRA